jgi:hypothetical protein
MILLAKKIHASQTRFRYRWDETILGCRKSVFRKNRGSSSDALRNPVFHLALLTLEKRVAFGIACLENNL